MSSRSITSNGPDAVARAVDLYVEAFRNNPVVTYIASHLDDERRWAFLPRWFGVYMTAAHLNAATFDEVGDGLCIGVLLKPGYKVDNPWTLLPAGFLSLVWNLGIGACKRMLWDFEGPVVKAQRLVLGSKEKFYYIFFAATQENARRQGLATVLIQHYQDIARSANCPIWIEATTEAGRIVYEKQGFEVVQEVRLGQGSHGENGKRCLGGDGVPFWCMIWRPADYKPS